MLLLEHPFILLFAFGTILLAFLTIHQKQTWISCFYILSEILLILLALAIGLPYLEILLLLLPSTILLLFSQEDTP